MEVLIATKDIKKLFNKEIITVGPSKDCDLQVDLGGDIIILTYSAKDKTYIIESKETNKHILFKNTPFVGSILLGNICRFNIIGSDNFIAFKKVDLSQEQPDAILETQNAVESAKITSNQPQINYPVFQDDDIKAIYGDGVESQVKIRINNYKEELENIRTQIAKEVSFVVNDIRKRLHLNCVTAIILNVALFVSSFMLAFGMSNYLTGLRIEETKNFINLPINAKALLLFTLIIFGVSMLFKRGMFCYFQNKIQSSRHIKAGEKYLLTTSIVFFCVFYIVNLFYYSTLNPFFAILISLFFTGMCMAFSGALAYIKSNEYLLSYELNKREFREDLETTISKYRIWIEQYINSMSENKIKTIKENLFSKQLKSIGEIILGIFTAPFLAYGVSNTLAGCFPEAAGWIRISGMRFSPIFLVLATFMIIFAFFAFTNAFWITRRIQASNVIKYDGFIDYNVHGVNILGIQSVFKLEAEKTRSFIIACCIVLIEFTMNTTYFMTEIGSDIQGIFLSIIAATVPTALLIAETYMLSSTKFSILVYEDIIDRRE